MFITRPSNTGYRNIQITHGIAPIVMNDIFRKRSMPSNTRNFSGFETKNIETVHYGLETIVYLDWKTWEFLSQKVKD